MSRGYRSHPSHDLLLDVGRSVCRPPKPIGSTVNNMDVMAQAIADWIDRELHNRFMFDAYGMETEKIGNYHVLVEVDGDKYLVTVQKA